MEIETLAGPRPSDASREIRLSYIPRPHFVPLHDSRRRWIFVVAHRRAGKTVALVNHLIRAAIGNPRPQPHPRYAYIGPSFEMAKDLVWNYLKQYTAEIPHIRFSEGELTCFFPNGATIRLYGGGSSYERLRGLYLDGAVLDEYPMLTKEAFTTVVRPCLADYRGFAIVSGTSNGQDHFYELKLRAETDPDWEIFDIPITDTGTDALSPQEVLELQKDMSPDEYAREMLCSFEAPVEGAYYTEALNALQSQQRITKVAPDLSTSLLSCWDLGIADQTAIWIFQICGREYHWIDYLEGNGRKLDHWAAELTARANLFGCDFRAHFLPHDVEVTELATGQSRKHTLSGLLAAPIVTTPKHNPADGISVVRSCLGVSWFDALRTRRGLARLRGYRKGKTGLPVHDVNCHGADAARTGCVGLPLIAGFAAGKIGERLRRKIRGLI